MKPIQNISKHKYLTATEIEKLMREAENYIEQRMRRRIADSWSRIDYNWWEATRDQRRNRELY